MSMSSFEDILALAQTFKVDEKVQEAELSKAKKMVDAVASAVQDDTENPQDDPAGSCKEWTPTLNQLLHAISVAQDCGVSLLLSKDPDEKMQGANALLKRWQGEAAMRQQQEQSSRASMKSSDPLRPSALLGLREDPPTFGTSSKVQGSGTKRKRTQTAINLVEEDEPHGVVVVNRPTVLGKVVHEVPCEACEKAGRQCVGTPDRSCDSCSKIKSRCDKSRGRGNKGGEKVVALEEKVKGKIVVPEVKGKAPVQSSSKLTIPTRDIQASPSRVKAAPALPEVLEIDDDETSRKKARTTAPSGPSAEIVVDAKQAVLSLESKVFQSRTFLKELQLRADVEEKHIASYQKELDRVKAVLEML